MVPYAAVGAGAGYLYYVAAHIEYHHRAGTLGPDFWPKAILGLVLATCVYEIVRTLAFGVRRQASGMLQDIVEESVDQFGDAGAGEPPQKRPLLLAGGIALTAAYVWLVPTLGFFLATAPYLAAFVTLGGYRRRAITLAVSLLGTLAIMFFFMKLVYVSLPLGTEPFVQVTFLLMKLMGIR